MSRLRLLASAFVETSARQVGASRRTVLEQEKRSGAGRGIYFKEKLGWAL